MSGFSVTIVEPSTVVTPLPVNNSRISLVSLYVLFGSRSEIAIR